MKYLFVILAILSFVITTRAQSAYVEQVFGFEHAEPRSVMAHGGQYFCSYNNGQVSVFDSENLQPRLVPTPSGAYVTDLYSADGLLWIHTSAGRLFYTINSGGSWVSYGHSVLAAFKPHGSGLYVAVSDTIHLLKRNGTVITDSVVRVVADLRPIESFAIKSDTVITIFQFTDSMSVFVENRTFTSPLWQQARAANFYQFDDGTIAYFSTFNRVYLQRPNLSTGFQDITSAVGVPSISGLGIGRTNGKLAMMFSGGNRVTNADSVIVVRIDPTNGGQVILNRPIEPWLGFNVLTMNDDTVYTLSPYGKVMSLNLVTVDSSLSILPNRAYNPLKYSVVQGKEGIIRSLLPVSKEIDYRHLLYTKQEIREPFEKESIGFRDSLGEVEQLLGDDQNGYVASGSESIAYSPSVAGPWKHALPIRGGRIYKLASGSLISSLLGNGVGVSEDQGKTWSVHYIKGMFGGFFQVLESADFLAFNRRKEIYILPRHLTGDTVARYLYSPVPGGDLTILGLQGDTAYFFHPMFAETSQESFNRFELLHVSRIGVLDSTVITLANPLANYSRATARLVNDTLVVYDRVTARFILIKNGEVIYESTLSQNVKDPFTLYHLATTTINSTRHIRIVMPQYGIATSIFPFGEDSAVSVVEQSISHYYISVVKPNPASGTIVVEIGKFVTADLNGVTLQLCAMDGKIERDFSAQLPVFGSGNEVKTVTLDVSGVATGAYLLVVRSSKNVHSYKVMVER